MAEFVLDLKAAARMCKTNSNCCAACPVYDFDAACIIASQVAETDDTGMEALAETVKEWAAENPAKTMLDVFYEHFPKAERLKNGTLRICPHHLDPSWGGLCDDGKTGDCRVCWAREVEG